MDVIATTVFEDGSFGFSWFDGRRDSKQWVFCMESRIVGAQVIGNIHENSDLVETVEDVEIKSK